MNGIRNAPLFLCYLLYPLVAMAWFSLGAEVSRNWIDLAWLLLGGMAITTIMITGSVKANESSRGLHLLLFIFLAYYLLRALISASFFEAELFILVMEMKPFFYFVIAILWVLAFGLPSRELFIKLGGWLGFILVLDMSLRSLILGTWVRAQGAGEINYEAALLLISFCFVLAQPKVSKRYGALIFLGLLASMSRTALLAAMAILIYSGQMKLSGKIVLVMAILGISYYSTVSRGQVVEDINTLDRFWMWFVGLKLLCANPMQAMVGFSTGIALPVEEIPKQLAWLWTSQQSRIDVDGIFPFQFHAFWLRVTFTHGLMLTLGVVAYLASATLRPSIPRAFRYLAIALLLEGMTMGVLYLSQVAVPFLMALRLGQKQRHSAVRPRGGDGATNIERSDSKKSGLALVNKTVHMA